MLAAFAAMLTLAMPAAAGAVDVRVGLKPAGARVVIDSPSKVQVRAELDDGHRLVFAIGGLDPGEALHGGGHGLVRNWRLDGADGGARLVLDLAGAGEVADRFLIPPSAGNSSYRYVIDLAEPRSEGVSVVAVSRADSRPAPRRRELSREAASSGRRVRVAHEGVPARLRKVIVIDAGHGGKDPGAQANGANEKDITLAAALHLRRRLLAEGRYKVVMTRTSDVFVPLEERVRIARRAGADLFIALHADSAGDHDATHGASVYTLSGHGETRVKEVLGSHEWFSRAAPRNDPAVKGILLDLTQRSTLNRSNEFAQLLVDRLSEKTDVLPRTHRDAGYFVLLAPDVPAVLLEMGFISSPIDEARLTDPAKRDALMDTVARAIDDYFRGQVEVATR
ncbi:MAG: N-acetylmuramoyl-L-alanine amidase family protein [Caulobacteraceae bacterium]